MGRSGPIKVPQGCCPSPMVQPAERWTSGPLHTALWGLGVGNRCWDALWVMNSPFSDPRAWSLLLEQRLYLYPQHPSSPSSQQLTGRNPLTSTSTDKLEVIFIVVFKSFLNHLTWVKLCYLTFLLGSCHFKMCHDKSFSNLYHDKM